jgi:uncharacterized protein (DUF736 family)
LSPQAPLSTGAAKKFPRPDKPASSRPLRCKFSRLADPPPCSGRSQARGDNGAFAVSIREPFAETDPANQPRRPIMAITLGTFTKFDNGAYTGTLRTLHVTVPVSIVPVDKMSDKAPDHRVYAGQRHEIGAGWSQVAKSSGETYINLKIGCPEFGPNWVRCRLVKLEQPAEDGATHMALWEPRDR